MTKLPPEEYFKSLPKKRIGTGILFFDEAGKLLIVKPNYKDGWAIPGGTADEGESPKSAAVRETKEEIGLDAQDLTLVCIHYSSAKGVHTESIQFIFFGGVLDSNQISGIKLADDELDEFKFVSTEEAKAMLTHGLSRRLPFCLDAIKNKTAIYLES